MIISTHFRKSIFYTATRERAEGFSLIEMAIVLAILSFLLGGLLPLLTGQMERQSRHETRKQMEEIKDALTGYAIINGILPCPTTQPDPTNANYGMSDATCSANVAAEGYLPWKTLGVTETDAWGSKRTSTASPWTGYWRYRVDRNFTTTITMTTGFCTATNDCLSIKDNNGNYLNSTSATAEHPVAIVYSTGQNITADGQNMSFEPTTGIYQSDVPNPAFDDMMIWISRPQLFNRMVAASKLP